MSLNTVIAFALLLKKITRKGSMRKKTFRNKMRKSTPVQQQQQQEPVKNDCISSGSDDDEDEEEADFTTSQETETEDDERLIVLKYNIDNKKKSTSSIIAPSIKSLQLSQKHNSLNELRSSIVLLSTKELDDDDLEENKSQISTVPLPVITVIVRDFAYPTDSPLHFGKPILKNQASNLSLSSPEFNGRDAKALFDFSPETEYEIPLKAGQSIWVQYRQCPGWLIADVQDETGLIPESYVEFI